MEAPAPPGGSGGAPQRIGGDQLALLRLLAERGVGFRMLKNIWRRYW